MIVTNENLQMYSFIYLFNIIFITYLVLGTESVTDDTRINRIYSLKLSKQTCKREYEMEHAIIEVKYDRI